MKQIVFILLIGIFCSTSAWAEKKTLSNNVLKSKGYDRLDGNSQFRLGCRYLVRSEERTTVYRPSVIVGMAIGFDAGDISYVVPSSNKTILIGSDGSEQPVTTWRNCVIL